MARFPRRARLLRPAAFDLVFRQGRREHAGCLMAVVRENGEDQARLGLAVSRKSLRRAVDRNTLKRQVRESFREHLAALPPCDVVITAKQTAAAASRDQLRADLETLWSRIRKRWPKPSSG